MATVAATASERASAERKFYSRYALAMAAIVVIGFAPSFYLRGLVHYPRPNPTLPPHVMIHGLVFTTWIVIFVAQTQLIAAGRRDMHMKLGMASFLFALILVPLSAISPFAVMLWLGWRHRREAQWHKRSMLVVALILMEPAIGRFPIGPPLLAVHAVGALLSLALFVPLLLWDRKTIGHLHPATSLGLSMTALAIAVRLTFLATGAWAPIARMLPGVGA